ncbi:hypothetical protein COMNV_01082 [Commensalibacter sp. Nvir]|uniref:hypothetical protein n=1 Tax=Commensalibacter sp. Nvir TaxID=3069817 RepID=UPI002D508725|nr:hypothetical protein COMNV_01082 [Commensalibacter sp. Nvir]
MRFAYFKYFKRSLFFTIVSIINFNFLSVTNTIANGSDRSNNKTHLNTIVFTTQPNHPLYQVALELSKHDLDFAEQHNDIPLILIGTANLTANNNIRQVLFIQLQSSSLCGSGGCTTTAYYKNNNKWIKILDSVTGNIEIQKKAHKTMHDLLVGNSIWIWNGKSYQELQKEPKLKELKHSIQKHQGLRA